jgi:hypothetical protein
VCTSPRSFSSGCMAARHRVVRARGVVLMVLKVRDVWRDGDYAMRRSCRVRAIAPARSRSVHVTRCWRSNAAQRVTRALRCAVRAACSSTRCESRLCTQDCACQVVLAGLKHS